MGRGSLGYSVAGVVFVLVSALALTACASAQQSETTTTPSADPPQPEAVATPAGRSVLDGVFTARQASRGGAQFRQVCVACHSISDFTGGRFRLVWAGRTVGDLFMVMSTIMPEDNPGSLTAEEYTNLVSYMLSENGYPTGDEDLPSDQSALASILIEAAGE